MEVEKQKTDPFRGPCLQGYTGATLVQNLMFQASLPGTTENPCRPALPLRPGHKNKKTRRRPHQLTSPEHFLLPALC